MVELYFKIQLLLMLIGAILFIVIVLLALYVITKDHIKHEILIKNGFTYDKGLGERVAYEYQPHFIKGNKRIRAKNAYNMTFKELKRFVKE